MAQSLRPKSRAGSTVPRITTDANSMYLMAFKVHTAEKLRLLNDAPEVDLKFEDAELAADMLRGLATLPKPGKGFQLELEVDGVKERVEVEPISRTTFRVVRLKKYSPPPLPRKKG